MLAEAIDGCEGEMRTCRERKKTRSRRRDEAKLDASRTHRKKESNNTM
jgi:hypothetical protein